MSTHPGEERAATESAAIDAMTIRTPLVVHLDPVERRSYLGAIGSWFVRFGTRFGIIYGAVFWLGRVAAIVPGFHWVAAQDNQMWRKLVPWIAKNVLRLDRPVPMAFSGSGDKLYDWVRVFGMLGIALIGALVWVWFDRRRRGERLLGELVRIGVRYALGMTMLSYGVSKILWQQMPQPGMYRLLQPYGESSPMGLLWTFMGQSWAYSAFAGGMEFLGGLLLFFRRTTTLGALLLVAVMANVLMMNLAFDVPVKLYSAHYLAFAVVLAVPDFRRLVNVLVLHRAAPAVTVSRPWPTARAGRLLHVVKALIVMGILWTVAGERVWRWAETPRAAKSEFNGIYDVGTFLREGVERPPLTTDSLRWRRVAFDQGGRVTVLLMTDARVYYQMRSAGPGKFTLEPFGARNPFRETFTYTRVSHYEISIEGRLNGSKLTITLQRSDERRLLLRERGFHWISEQPFNR
jgi:hypothetical protein